MRIKNEDGFLKNKLRFFLLSVTGIQNGYEEGLRIIFNSIYARGKVIQSKNEKHCCKCISWLSACTQKKMLRA